MSETIYCFELRSIYAWRNQEGGWEWNNSFKMEEGICLTEKALTPRMLLKKMREWGYLSAKSKGRVKVYDDQDGLIEFQAKGTDEPLFALLLNNTYEN